MDEITIALLIMTVSSLFFVIFSSDKRSENKRNEHLNEILEEENDTLNKILKGENIPFEDNYEKTKFVYEKVYHH